MIDVRTGFPKKTSFAKMKNPQNCTTNKPNSYRRVVPINTGYIIVSTVERAEGPNYPKAEVDPPIPQRNERITKKEIGASGNLTPTEETWEGEKKRKQTTRARVPFSSAPAWIILYFIEGRCTLAPHCVITRAPSMNFLDRFSWPG